MHYDMLSLLQVLFAFLHDYTVLDQLLHINLTPLKAYIPGIVHDTKFCEIPKGRVYFNILHANGCYTHCGRGG